MKNHTDDQKLLAQRNPNMNEVRAQVNRLINDIYHGNPIGKISEELYEDLIYVIDPSRVLIRNTSLIYGNIFITEQHLQTIISLGRNNLLNERLDKRDNFWASKFSSLYQFDLRLTFTAILDALAEGRIKELPLELIVSLAWAEFEDQRFRDPNYKKSMWDTIVFPKNEEEFKKYRATVDKIKEALYKDIPKDQKVLFEFSRERYREEKRLADEERKARFRDPKPETQQNEEDIRNPEGGA